MLTKPHNTSQSAKKHVHWDATVENNEGKTKASKKQKTDKTKQKKKPFSPELIEGIKATIKEHFKNGTFEKLEEILNKYPSSKKMKILSVGDYELFLHAASNHNVKALNFIVNRVPKETAYNMLHEGNLSSFKNFLICTRTLEQLNKLNHQDRIDGFEIFLKIDHESVQEVLSNFEINSLETRSIKESVIKDFDIALTQVQEARNMLAQGQSTESLSDNEYEASKNDLLKHLEPKGNIKLNLSSTTDLSAFNTIAVQANINSEGPDILNLAETTKKAAVTYNVSNASSKTL